tara:strand:+ start:952 stop:1524 length:573 start_codon:yes stop_codon:yes gene_type:complete
MQGILAEKEQIKYEKIWTFPAYRRLAVGDSFIGHINKLLGLEAGKTLIDFGCGTGRPAQKIKDLGLRVVGIDHAKNCLDAEVDIEFIQSCLWTLPEGLTGDYGLCTDVLEHIPTEKVDDVLRGIKRCVPVCFISVDDVPDNMGALIGEKLHMTVRSLTWWENKLNEHFHYVKAYSQKTFIVNNSHRKAEM